MSLDFWGFVSASDERKRISTHSDSSIKHNSKISVPETMFEAIIFRKSRKLSAEEKCFY
jgi:hypothetical protein